MAFTDTYDQILNRILTDYQNQDPAADISQGSLLFLRAAALASALWGLNRDGSYVDSQRFGDTCDEETLDHYIALRLPVVVGETFAAKRSRVLDDIRHPPAGGNRYDYARWAKESSIQVAGAWCVPGGQGPGTTDVIILADVAATGSEIPTIELRALVRAYIVDICPTGVRFVRVLAPEVLLQNITATRQNSDYPAAYAVTEITNYLAGFVPGQQLYRDQIRILALGGGEGGADITTPLVDVVPTPYQMIRPGGVNVA